MELKEVCVANDCKSNGVSNARSASLLVQNGPLIDGQTNIQVSRQMSIQSSVSSTGSVHRSERGHHRDRRRERLNTELLLASAAGDIEAVKRVLSEGASVNATCRRSRQSALHSAAAKGHDALVKLLLNQGSDPEARDALGRQPIHLATWNNHMNTLAVFAQVDTKLLSSQIQAQQNPCCLESDLDSWNHQHESLFTSPEDFTEGSTPLHLACKKSNVNCVNFLLHMGADVNVRDSRGLTPLDVVGTRDDDIILPSSLIPTINEELDDIPENEPESQYFPTFDTISFPSAFKKSLKEDIVVRPPVIDGVVKKNIVKGIVTNIAKSLIEKGAKMPLTQCKEGYVRNQSRAQMTALHTAVEDDNLELVKLLLEQNGCMLSWNREGDTPLHVAVKKRFLEPLRAMITWKNNSKNVIDVRNEYGCTLLHVAVMIEWADGVSLLLELGADVKTTNNLKENVFHLAAERGNFKMLEELLSISESIKVLNDRDSDYHTPLCKAVDNGYLDCTKILIENGADPNVFLPGDRTLIHLCAEYDFYEILDYLINETSCKELIDMRSRSERGGTTAFQSAAMLGFTRSVDIFLAAGCDVRIESTEDPHLGSTALHMAARSGHNDVVRSILNYDSDVLACTDSRGWYPLHIAASSGHSSCVSTMIQYGADLADQVIDDKGVHLTGLEVIIYCIPQPSDFLVEIFDSYIHSNDRPISDPNCEIRVKFDVLIPKPTSCKQLRVLTALLNCGKEKIQERLLLHPIVQTFLHLKWRKLRLFFFIIALFYLIFTLSLTCLAVWYYILKNEASTAIQSIHCVLFASLVPIVFAETLNVVQLQRYYVLDYESWVKWFVFACSLVVGLADPNQWWARHLTALTVLLAWIEMLFLVARCPNWGFYVLMFSRVAIKVIKVLITFTFLLMGFTFAFMIQFDGKDPFNTVWQSVVKVFVMMIEFDYEATFENLGDSDWLSFVSRAMFLFFVVLVAIVLMNLMVGLAVSDIAVLETQGRTQRLAKQVSFLSLLEILVGSNSVAYMPRKVKEWAANRRTVLPEVIIRSAGTTAVECNETILPRHLREAITEKVGCALQTKESNNSNISLNDITNRLDRIEKMEWTSSIISEVSELKKIVKSQTTVIHQLKQALVSSSRRPSAQPSTGDGRLNDTGLIV